MRRTLASAFVLAIAVAVSVGGSQAATANVTVTLDVLSSTQLDAAGCPAAARSFGTVLPDTSIVATAPCAISFGSSNNSSMLKLYQSDNYGNAMYSATDGTLDFGFSGDGKQNISFPGGGTPTSGMQQADGRVVMVGNSRPAGNADLSVARLDTNGVLDGTFNGGGKLVLPLSGGNDDGAGAVTQQRDGKLVIVGNQDFFFGLNLDAAAVRLNANGTVDNTFGGGDGIITWPIDGSENGSDVDVVGSYIYVSGSEGPWNDATTQDGFISRLTPAGALDPNWGTGGTVTVNAAAGASDRILDTTFLNSGKIMVVGTRYNGSDTDLYVGRLNANGSPDGTYGTGGFVTVTQGAGLDDSLGRSHVDQLTGEVLVNGYQGPLAGPVGWVRRLKADGTNDTSWGTNGMVTFNYGAGRTGGSYGSWTPDMRTIYVTGVTQTGPPDKDFFVYRIQPNGTVTKFGPSGQLDFFADNDYGNSVFEGRDGGAYVVGPATNAGAAEFGIIRFAGGPTIPDYGGAAVFGSANTQAAFGACLEARSGAGVAGGWTLDGGGGGCTAVVGDPWNAIADTSADATAKVLGSPTPGVTNATATIRFGIKTALATPPKDFSAPLVLEVVAPDA